MEYGEIFDTPIKRIQCTHNLQGVNNMQQGVLFITNYKLLYKPFGLDVPQRLKDYFTVPNGLITDVKDRSEGS
jgi:hypothetical protein